MLQRNLPAIEDRLIHSQRAPDPDKVSFRKFLHWVLRIRTMLQFADDLQLISLRSGHGPRNDERRAVYLTAVDESSLLRAHRGLAVLDTAFQEQLEGASV